MASRRAKTIAAASILHRQYAELESDESDKYLSEDDGSESQGDPSYFSEQSNDDSELSDDDEQGEDNEQNSADDESDGDSSDESSESEQVDSSNSEQVDEVVESHDDQESNDDDNEANESSNSDSDDSTTLYSLPKYVSKNGEEKWESFPVSSSQGRRSQANILHQRPGPTRYAIRECTNISSSFLLFFRPPILDEICKWSNKEGQRIYKERWAAISTAEIKKFISVLVCLYLLVSINQKMKMLLSYGVVMMAVPFSTRL